MPVTLTLAGIAQAARAAYDAGELQAQKHPGTSRCVYSKSAGPCAIGVAIEDQKEAFRFDRGTTAIGSLISKGDVIIEGIDPKTVFADAVADLVLHLQSTHDRWAGVYLSRPEERAYAEADFVNQLVRLETYVAENAK